MAISTDNFSFSTFLSVDFGRSLGSGFRVRHNDVDYIVTAKHVVFEKNTLLSDLWIKSRNYFGTEIEGYSAKVTMTADNVFTSDNTDLAVIKLLPQFSYEVEYPGVEISYAIVADMQPFDAVKIGANIFLIGFPSSLTTDQFYDVDRPLLRTGIVAGKNMSNNTFVVDSVAYYGVSGGPIVQLDAEGNIKLIGVVSRFVPFITEWRNKHEPSMTRQDFSNSGYAVCFPLNQVLQTIENQV